MRLCCASMSGGSSGSTLSKQTMQAAEPLLETLAVPLLTRAARTAMRTRRASRKRSRRRPCAPSRKRASKRPRNAPWLKSVPKRRRSKRRERKSRARPRRQRKRRAKARRQQSEFERRSRALALVRASARRCITLSSLFVRSCNLLDFAQRARAAACDTVVRDRGFGLRASGPSSRVGRFCHLQTTMEKTVAALDRRTNKGVESTCTSCPRARCAKRRLTTRTERCCLLRRCAPRTTDAPCVRRSSDRLFVSPVDSAASETR